MKKELKKEDVYLVVDTPKKAKKLKKVLNMFGEKIYSESNHEDDDHNGINMYWGYGFSDGGWQGVNTNLAGHCMNIFKEVSIKELRNILAVEHLKEGDVVVFNNGLKGKIVGFNVDSEIIVNDEDKDIVTCFICDFIRYATESEKELLRINSLKEQAKEVIKPVSEELEVGKWYKFDSYGNNYLLLYNGSDYACGFMNYEWCDNWSFSKNGLQKRALGKEATPKEVEKALIEEAKRRYKVGDKINLLRNITDREILGKIRYEIGNYYPDDNTFYYSKWLVFEDGQWATIIEQPTDKFAELKEAYKNGAEIQFYYEKLNKWFDWIPCWNPKHKYRIKPEEKPKVGDLVKAWDNDERDFIIGKLNDIDDSTYPFVIHSICYKNAKKITPQEAMELLTDYCR